MTEQEWVEFLATGVPQSVSISRIPVELSRALGSATQLVQMHHAYAVKAHKKHGIDPHHLPMVLEISWDEFFQEFEQRKLALLYDPESLFSKIIGRDTAERRAQGDHDASRHSRPAGGHREELEVEDGGREDRYSLKEREYRDDQGEVHHHTNRYMEEHEKD